MRPALYSPAIIFALALSGCQAAESDSARDDAGTTCAGAQPTWSTWGAGFFASYCRTCHSVDSPDRFGAPVGIDFDSQAQVAAMAERIRVTVLEDETMPIGGGVPDDELAMLDRFLRCGL